jgi:hypothetical protein
MTAPKETDEDGALRPALQALADAVAGLCTPLEEYFESRLITTPSLYLQLRDAVTGEQVNTGGGGGSKSRPPFWTDAFDLFTEIDTALEIWQPAFTGVPATVGRLHWLLQRKWRPQDTKRIESLGRQPAVLEAPHHRTVEPAPQMDHRRPVPRLPSRHRVPQRLHRRTRPPSRPANRP